MLQQDHVVKVEEPLGIGLLDFVDSGVSRLFNLPIPHVDVWVKDHFLAHFLFDKLRQIGDLGGMRNRPLVAETFRKNKTCDLLDTIPQHLITAALVECLSQTDGQGIGLSVLQHGFRAEVFLPITVLGHTETLKDLFDYTDVIHLLEQAT